MADPITNGNATAVLEHAERVRTPLFEIGVSGKSIYRGQVVDEFLPELQGRRGQQVYREMADNDPVIGALLFLIEMTFRELEPRAEPATESAADVDAAEFLDSNLHDMSHDWPDFMSDVVSMFPYGWAYFETVYKLRRGEDGAPSSEHNDGRIGWRKLALRAQTSLDRWEFDEAGGVKGMHQRPPLSSETQLIPIEKSLLFRTRHNGGNPEGRSILRTAYVPWFYRKHLQTAEAIALERIGAGIPVIRLPENPTATDITNAKNAIRRFKTDESMGFTVPHGVELELAFNPGRNVADGYESAIVRYRQEILLSVLAQFLALGMDKAGSWALSRTQRDVLQIALGGWLRGLEAVLNRYAVKRLFMLNPGLVPVGGKRPKLHLGTVGDVNLDLFVTALRDLIPQGAFVVDDNLRRRLREIFDVPEPDEKTAQVKDLNPPDPDPDEDEDDEQPPAGGPEVKANSAAPFRLSWHGYP